MIESTWTPKIQIKYVDIKNQLADLLTKGNFTRDEWNHFLRLFNILSAISNQLTNKSKIMSKRHQEGKPGEGERVVAVSNTGLGASNSQGTLGMQSYSSNRSGTEKPVAKGVESVNENTALSSQVWHQNENTRSGIGKPAAKTSKRLSETSLTHHIFQISSNVNHLEIVLSNVQQKLSRAEGDEMLDVSVNEMIWGVFVSATFKAPVHLGQDCQESIVRYLAEIDPESQKVTSTGYLRSNGIQLHG